VAIQVLARPKHHIVPLAILVFSMIAGIWFYLIGVDINRVDDTGAGNRFSGLRAFRLAAGDAIFKLRNKVRPASEIRSHPDIVLLDIDDETIKRFKQFPIDRQHYASALNLLHEAKLVGFDIFLTEPAHRRLSLAQMNELRAEVQNGLQELLDFNMTQEDFIQSIDGFFTSADYAVAAATKVRGQVLWPGYLSERYFGQAHLELKREEGKNLADFIYRHVFQDRALFKKWAQNKYDPRVHQEILTKWRTLYAAKSQTTQDMPPPPVEIEDLTINLLREIDEKTILDMLNLEFPELEDEEAEDTKLLFLADGQWREEQIPELCRKFNFIEEQILTGYRLMLAQLIDENLEIAMEQLETKDPLEAIAALLASVAADTAWPRVAYFEELHARLLERLIFDRLPKATSDADTLITTHKMTQPIFMIGRESGIPSYAQISPDDDGIVRAYPMVMKYEDHLVPSLSLAMACVYYGVSIKDIEVYPGSHIVLPVPGDPIHIPIDIRGRMPINWQADWKEPGDFQHVSFQEILETLEDDPTQLTERAKQTLASLKNKIVIIGLTATGTHDLNPMPLSPRYPMVGVHANILSNILNRDFIPLENKRMAIAAIICIVLAVGGGAHLFRHIWSLLLTITSMGVLFNTSVMLLRTRNIQLTVVEPILAGFAAYLGIILFQYFVEERAKRKTEMMFGTMVSHEVLDYMQANPASFGLTGEKREATMFFSDVSGFTTISETQTPDGLALVLNRYLTPMSDIIMKYKGYIDKYEGDAIMADYGVPVWVDEDPHSHAWMACWSAIEQQDALQNVVAPAIDKEFGVLLSARMGINTGMVSAGNMGSEQKFQYTVMGDAVNQAARFEPANKEFDTWIMIGEPTYEMAKHKIEARFLTLMVVKGKTEPVKAYELIAKKGEISDDKRRVLELFQEAWDLHAKKQWDPAIKIFKHILTIDPKDGPSPNYIKLCEGYKTAILPEGWQGEFIQTSK